MTEDTPRVYVASLSDYNAGTLHGRWIDADKDADAIHADIAQMLAESPTDKSAEEWAIHDYEGFHGITISESEDIETVAELARLLAEHGEAYAAYVSCFGAHYATPDGFEERYLGQHDSEEEYAAEYVESTGILSDMPDNLRCDFDYGAFARDMFINDVASVEADGGGIHVFCNC